ncbi:unnamed protein product [Soboliphyme baturini]|uniref:Uncharacterized protein n=1 Tax=Soboliphyme baturini TaxID=241478 RepID=A0A183J5A5_9BILA|nr:unnamed protein product [Soboliphyme baturini]
MGSNDVHDRINVESLLFHKAHLTPTYFVLDSVDDSSVVRWEENVGEMIDFCTDLLNRSSESFWKIVSIDDCSIVSFVNSYLVECPRYCQPESMRRTFFSAIERVSLLQNSLHEHIFRLLVRLSDSAEAQPYIAFESFFGDFMHSSGLFDLPMLLDICAIYGKDNPDSVVNMVNKAFSSEPRYTEDLETVLSLLARVC